jgi:hypothetical protein
MSPKKYHLGILGTILVISSILFSCRSPKMTAVSCPEFSNHRYTKDAVDHNKKKNKALITRHSNNALNRNTRFSGRNQVKSSPEITESTEREIILARGNGNITAITRSEYSDALTASAENSFVPKLRKDSVINAQLIAGSDMPADDLTADQQSGCDTIITKSGSRIIGKVEEIGLSEIRYRRCDNLSGPIISISKSGVNRILFVNGTKETIVSDDPIIVNNNEVKPVYNNAPVKTEPLGLAGFIGSLVGLFIGGVPLGMIGIIFGALSLSKIKREPARYKGRGLSIAAIIIGIIAIAGAIVVYTTM